MRRVLFILTGPDTYKIPNRLEHEVPMYYDNLAVKSLGHRAGQMYRDLINFDDNQFHTIRTSGSSVLTKALTMPLKQLKHLISWAANGKTVDQIAEKVDSFIVQDLHWAMDATYAMILNNNLNIS